MAQLFFVMKIVTGLGSLIGIIRLLERSQLSTWRGAIVVWRGSFILLGIGSMNIFAISAGAEEIEASINKTTVYEKIKKRTEHAKILLDRAIIEFNDTNYIKSMELADSVHGEGLVPYLFILWGSGPDSVFIRFGNTFKSSSLQTVALNQIVQDSWDIQEEAYSIMIESNYSLLEIFWNNAGWFRYGEGTFERQVEFDILSWYKESPSGSEWNDREYIDRLKNHTIREGPNFDYGFLKGGSIKRIVKSIEFSAGILLIRMRADPDDLVEVNFSKNTIEFKHPREFLKKFRKFIRSIWNLNGSSSWKYQNQNREVNEIIISLYYPGSDQGTENPIAKFGLTRPVGEHVKWNDIKVNDGTFQDFLKENGTYWLHSQIPDMGTPIQHINR